MSDILVVDDERDIRELICDILEDEGFATRRAGTSDECMAELNKAAPGLMILDIWLKDSNMDGIDILKQVKLDNPDVPVVIISGHGNIEIAVAAIRQGAYDFIEKPFNIDQLLVVIRRAMETSRLRRENAQLRRQEVRGTDMIGNSAGMKLLKSQLEKVTKIQWTRDADGRAGVGQGGGRALDPRQFEPCQRAVRHGFLGGNPARSHGRSAVRPRNARARRRTGGCWNRPMAGSSISTRWPTCRWARSRRSCACWWTSPLPAWAARRRCASICASSRRPRAIFPARSPPAASARNSYHRLNVVPIEVPPLEDRREDIPELARHFIELFNTEQGLALRELGEDAVAMLQTMSWPGNVRQLRNVIERVLILGEGTGRIEAGDLPGPGESRGGGDGEMSPVRVADNAAAARGARAFSNGTT